MAGRRNSLDVLGGDILDVEADVVVGKSLGHGLVVHLDGLYLGGPVDGGDPVSAACSGYGPCHQYHYTLVI